MNEVNFNEIDLTLAIQLQAQFEEELRVQREEEQKKLKSLEVIGHKWNPKYKSEPEPEQEKLSVSLIDPCWELLDPVPNIYDLFLTFNHQFFWGRLMGVEVRWSPRMTLCAGQCHYQGRGGLCSVRLSVPLLKLRPRKDLIETLLHEMIHAYLFVTHNNTDRDGHGPQFHKHMHRINNLAGTKISVYHSFHDEVAVYRQHVWRCNGPCRKRPPYFGLVKRSMNRPPSPRDLWWTQHVQTCGGTYSKIKEPEGYGVKKSKSSRPPNTSTKDIRSFFPAVGDKKRKKSPDPPHDGKSNKSSKSSRNPKGSINGLSGHNGGLSVNQVGVQNASNAKVHGFSKSINSNSGNQSSRTNPQVHSGVRSVSTSNGRGSFTKTIRSGSFGSKTIVTKKQNTSSNPPKQETDPSPGTNFVPFSGKGFGLGGIMGVSSQLPKSRLLSQWESTPKGESDMASVNQLETKKANPSQSGTNPCASIEDITSCPLCQIDLSSEEFETHIADCLGDFDQAEDFGMEVTQPFCTDNRSTPSDGDFQSIQNSRQTQKSKTTDSVNSENSISSRNLNSDASFKAGSDLPDETLTLNHYSCPVCDKKFTINNIDQHVNSHFDA